MSAERNIFSLIRDIVRHAIAPLDFYATYRARAVSQASDGTLEVEPEDKRLPGMTKLPIRHSIPGVSVKVAPETKVLIAFENGDRRRPVVTGFEKDALLELVVTATTKVTVDCPSIALGSGGRPVACQGDLVQLGGPGTLVTLTVIAPVPAPPGVISPSTPIIGYLSFSATGAPDPPDVSGLTCTPLNGAIATGSDVATA